jgi:hypothetical protein
MKAIAAALLITGIGPAFATDTTGWATVGNWAVMIDSTLGNGCFMVTSYTLGTSVRVGINNMNKNGYVLIGNTAWRSLEIGKEYKLTFQFSSSLLVFCSAPNALIAGR